MGLGMRFFFNRWMTLRTELRDLIYREKTKGATETTGASYQVRTSSSSSSGCLVLLPHELHRA